MMTGSQKEILHCSPSTSLRKQKKVRSMRQPQFRSENTSTTIEAEQILLALQQLAANSNSANLNNNVNRISKLPKSLTTTMPTFDGKLENSNCLKMCSRQVWKSTISWRKKTKEIFSTLSCVVMHYKPSKTSPAPTEKIWEKSWLCSVKKNVKPQSMATAKHKFQRLVFNPANQKLIDFLDELQKLAKGAFGVAAQAIFEQFIYAKMPLHLKKSINQAQLENGTNEQIVSHLEMELN